MAACPRCGTGGAYRGLLRVDCLNAECRHHPTNARLGVVKAERVEELWREVDRLASSARGGVSDQQARERYEEVRSELAVLLGIAA